MLIDGLKLVEGSQVTNMVVESGSTFPEFPDSGELFFKPGEGLHFYSGTEWIKLSGLVNGKLDVSQLPSIAITDTFVVASQADMLATPAQQGDVAIRTDIGKSFILAASPATTLANWVELAQRTLVGYDIAVSVFGKPTNAEVVLRFRACRAYTLLSDQTNGQAKAAVAATATTVFTVAKNGSQVGTITFAAASTTATISIASNVTFAVGDVITITAPAAADPTLSDVDFTLVATQN